MKDGHCEIQASEYCDNETICGCEGCRFWVVDKDVKLKLINTAVDILKDWGVFEWLSNNKMYISEKACIERFVEEVERLSD